MLAVGDTLVVGRGGRAGGPEPAQRHRRAGRRRSPRRAAPTTSSAWSTWWARVSRVGDSVCARAFQAAVGCVDAARAAALLWTQAGQWRRRRAAATTSSCSAPRADGDVHRLAPRRDGERAWVNELLLHRELTRAAGARALGGRRRRHRPACTSSRAKTARRSTRLHDRRLAIAAAPVRRRQHAWSSSPATAASSASVPSKPRNTDVRHEAGHRAGRASQRRQVDAVQPR